MTERDDYWVEYSKRVLKAELRRRGVGYRRLAEMLTESGAAENERNLANKIARGGFTAAFFLRCLSVIGCKEIKLGDE